MNMSLNWVIWCPMNVMALFFVALASSVLRDSCQFLLGRDHFGVHTAFLWADRVQVPETDQGPDSREQVRNWGKKKQKAHKESYS